MDELVELGADWVGIAEAAATVGVPTGTIRHWYRTGRVRTRRRDGDSGPFLVDADQVRALAALPTRAETEEMLAGAQAHEDCDREIAAMRSDLAESHELAVALQHQIDSLQAELDRLRRDRVFGSVTSTAWVDESQATYGSPIRPQGRLLEPGAWEDDVTPDVDLNRFDREIDLDLPRTLDLHLDPLAYGGAEDDLLPAADRGRKRR